ncbi:MAG TPA: c-type cytochrome [Candidatus Baltobacteraceae bacterium]|nr:c-type cytochrome [Candidatus Baltobacteraceae bacterium]
MNNIVRLACVAGIIMAGLILADSHSKAIGAQPSDGKAVFLLNCAVCHQANGQGGGPYPPLAGNPDVQTVDSAGVIQTVLNGRTGPITLNGTQYGGNMPSWRELSDADIAAVLTYVRSAWHNSAPAVSADQIASARAPVALSGEALFAAHCATCHQPSGGGTDAFPPLAGNPVVAAANPGTMIAVIVNGRTGPLTVNGKTYNGQMPTWKGQLSNADIASVATYVRSSWGNGASAVTEQEVAAAGAPVSAQVGASVYAKNCAACHGASGAGGIGPALAGNPRVNISNPTSMLTTIVQGRSVMPSWRGQLAAADIAAVATYVRSSWGNNVPAVSVQQVTAIK